MIEHQWENHGLVRKHKGVANLREIAQSDANVQADPKFDEVHYIIDDFSDFANVLDFDMSYVDELAAIASAAVRYPSLFRHAVVAKSPVAKKLADDFVNSELFDYPVRKFEQMREARRWVEAWDQVPAAGNQE